jgi:hypothetical protein
MTDAPKQSVTAGGTAERRAQTRLRSTHLILINLADQNGGVASDITEDGLALAVAMPLVAVDLPSVQIQFPGSKDWIEVRGQIVWKSESKRRAGVRFVDLTADARQRIRSWIASEVSRGRFPAEGKVAVLQARRSRDIAEPRTLEASIPEKNSVIAAERRTHDLDRSAGPPVALGGTGKGVAKPDQQETGSIASGQDIQEHSHRGPDRRLHQRRKILSLCYVEWDGNDGGVAYNLGEGGMALASALVLAGDHLRSLRLQIPGAKDWIEVSGQIAWKAKSEKRAGLRFVGLTEDARRRIKYWVSGEAISDEVQAPRDRSERKRALYQSANLISSPGMTGTSTPVASQVLSAPRSGVGPSGDASVPGVVAAKARPISRSSYQAVGNKRNLAERQRPVGGRERHRGKLAALIGVAAVAYFAIGWTTWNAVKMSLAERRRISSESARPTVIPTGNERVTVPNDKSASLDRSPRERDQVPPDKEPLIAQRPSTAAESLLQKASSQKSAIVTPDAAGTSRKELKSTLSEPGSRGHATNGTLSSTVSVDRPTEKIVQPQPVSILPAAQPQAEIEIPPQLSAALPVPNDALPVDHKDKEGSLLPPRQAEMPVNVTGSVAIVADRYPSIRLPLERSSKKSPTGTSLQLGHLISRVEPVYPAEAKAQGVEGAVEMHAIIGRDGSVESLVSVIGPPLLVPAAVSAVRQWRYTETLLAGRPVETEEDIAFKFRLSKTGTPE